MTDYVARHKGIVTAVSPDGTAVDLRLVDEAADCGGCALKGLCSPANTSAAKDAVVITANCGGCLPGVGDFVEVGLPDSVRWFSTVVALLLPILLFVGVLLAAITLNAGDAVAVVAALLSITVYYIILIPLRRRLSRRARWNIIN
jgi:positive regulator of sigma E activity